MIQKTIALILVLMLVLIVVGCGTPDDTEIKKVGEATASEEVSQDVDEVDALTEDLDTSELDELNQDLDEINW